MLDQALLQRVAKRAAVYLPDRNSVIMFSGLVDRTAVGEVWKLSLAAPPQWTKLNVGEGPGTRSEHETVYNSKRTWVLRGKTASRHKRIR